MIEGNRQSTEEASEGEIEDTTEVQQAERKAEREKLGELSLTSNGKLTHTGQEKFIAKRKASIYAFFDAAPTIEWTKDGKRGEYLLYQCTQCGTKIRQGLLTSDKSSTS